MFAAECSQAALPGSDYQARAGAYAIMLMMVMKVFQFLKILALI